MQPNVGPLCLGARAERAIKCDDIWEVRNVERQSTMSQFARRSQIDRRGGNDRRQANDLLYFAGGGVEHRTYSERRELNERRTDWARISPWASAIKRWI